MGRAEALLPVVARRASAAASRVFRDAGAVILQSDDVHAVFDCGPFGRGSGGHSHSDSLELVIRSAGEDVLVDPGTYTYVGSERERNWFRGSGAHSTVRVDARDQAIPAGPFRWNGQPHVELITLSLEDMADLATGRCEFRAEGTSGLAHRRSVLFGKSPSIFPRQTLVVCDVVSGLSGVHRVEQLWHAGCRGDAGEAKSRQDRIRRAIARDRGRAPRADRGVAIAVVRRKNPSTILASSIDTLPSGNHVGNIHLRRRRRRNVPAERG